MTPDPKRVAVLLDAARECYGDDSEQVRWLMNPDAVRELLKHEPTYADFNDRECSRCGVGDGEAHRRCELPHDEHCPVAAAWRALGDPRGAADIERAHDEALRTLVVPLGSRLDPRSSALPAVTWVDDAEWVDTASASILRARIEASPAMLAMRQTNAEIAESARRELARWSRRNSDTRGMEAVEDEARLDAWGLSQAEEFEEEGIALTPGL